MNPKLYFFSDGQEKQGPYTVEQLKEKPLTKTSLIWTEGELYWHPITSFPELMQALEPLLLHNAIKITPVPQQKMEPPPLPGTRTVKSSTPSKRLGLILLFVWTAIHLLVLLLSYMHIQVFDEYTVPARNEIWPFLDFTEQVWNGGYFYVDSNRFKSLDTHFRGILYGYDWTDFALYAGAAWAVYLIIHYAMKKQALQSH